MGRILSCYYNKQKKHTTSEREDQMRLIHTAVYISKSKTLYYIHTTPTQNLVARFRYYSINPQTSLLCWRVSVCRCFVHHSITTHAQPKYQHQHIHHSGSLAAPRRHRPVAGVCHARVFVFLLQNIGRSALIFCVRVCGICVNGPGN